MQLEWPKLGLALISVGTNRNLFRFQLVDTRLRLSCAIHGYNIFRLDGPPSGGGPTSPTTTVP